MPIAMSTPNTMPILVCMSKTLARLIKEKREDRGWSQRLLAETAGIPQPALSDIERGQTKLPNPDVRRRLARVLGLSHLDLLIAAGEITEEELREAGKVGHVESSPETEEMVRWVRARSWDQHDIDWVKMLVSGPSGNAAGSSRTTGDLSAGRPGKGKGR